MPLVVTYSTQVTAGRRSTIADVMLAPLAVGDYVLELTYEVNGEQERMTYSFRIDSVGSRASRWDLPGYDPPVVNVNLNGNMRRHPFPSRPAELHLHHSKPFERLGRPNLQRAVFSRVVGRERHRWWLRFAAFAGIG